MANISEALYDWSNTGGSNQPDSGDAATIQADLQAIQAGVRGWLAHKGSDIASVAGTTDIGAVEGFANDITGTEVITGLGTVSAGIHKVMKFEGAATLTHNATSLILPGAVDITTANGDIGWFISEGSGNWRCLLYTPASGVVPTGVVMPYAGLTAPNGFLLCYGQAVSRTTYAALFAVIADTYGVGDGSTTFNLPDLRGRVVAGQDDMGGTSANRLTSPINGDTLGAAGGAESVTLTSTEMPAHSHTIGGDSVADGNTNFTDAATGGTGTPGNFTSSTTGSGGAHANVQPTFILNYIIKI